MHRAIAWTRCHALEKNRLPAEVCGWLLDSGSLTEKLIRASDGDFTVQLLRQSWQLPSRDEAALLGIKTRQLALVREVLLCCHGQPWVFARSVIPQQSLNGPLRFLRRLKNQALGGLLFKDPRLQRSRFQIARIKLPHAAIAFTPTAPATVYGRRSLFLLKNQPLLVAEIFLPNCQL